MCFADREIGTEKKGGMKVGCWGITAFESDAGLDAVDLIRENLPDDGKMDLKTMIRLLQEDGWCSPQDVTDGDSHSSPMALAEIIVKFRNKDMTGLDADLYVPKGRKFAFMTSFTADKESIGWLKGYLIDTLKYSRENAARGRKWNGWFKEKDWNSWQNHMECLIRHMDELLSTSEDTIELIQPETQEMSGLTERNNGISGMRIT